MDTKEIIKKENKAIKFIIVSVLIITVISLIGVAFARYITSINGNASMDIAKWSFNYKILDSTQTEEVDNFAVTRTDNNADVDSSTIAPGTSGEFIIEIDATGTETLLTYDTIITFTNKPTNLNFYSDSQKTQPIIIENNRYLNFNGFMSLTDNKKIDIPVYWEWPLETGNTEKEIEDNDVEDTSFIGKTMSMQIATTGRQVMENPYANSVASTTINGVVTRYNSVQAAIDAAGTNEGAIVTVIANNTTETITIGANQNIILNTNGKVLTSTGKTITNSGILKVVGNGTVSSTASNIVTIDNFNKLELGVCSINSVNYMALNNRQNAQIVINSTNINAKGNVIYNQSNLSTEENPAIKIINGRLICNDNYYFIYSNSSGTIVVLNGNITGGIQNDGNENIIIYGGSITTTKGHGIRNNHGYVKFYGGELTSTSQDGIWSVNSDSKVLITGGRIKGKTSGITGNGEKIIGINDGKVNQEIPVIICTDGSGIAGSGRLSYFDGIIKARGTSIISTIAEQPTGYTLTATTETIDGAQYNVTYWSK